MLQIILSLLIISSIGALLALMLEVADYYMADYGESRIVINEEKDLTVEGGRPLLSTLMEAGIFIPSGCGGKGTCALCRIKIPEGGGPLLPTERPYLDEEERQANVRLSCQVKVRNDLRIEIPEELFRVKEFTVKVARIEDLTPAIKAVTLKILPPQEGITFKPGQYIQLKIPKYKRSKEPEYRAYSISSGSGDHHNIELVITKAPEGIVSTYVHAYMKEGEELTITGPFGEFYLRDSERDILFIATGSGLAPIKSILNQMEREQIQRKATLFFGARTRKDLYYYEELRELEKKIPDFSFMPTLSRATEEDKWEGEKGRVTGLIEKYVPEKAALDVYICGAPAMVESCFDLLKEKGIPEKRILFDTFE
jgi:Na+-transporting NADH:ubiquinone oxidoreductase subunit F